MLCEWDPHLPPHSNQGHQSPANPWPGPLTLYKMLCDTGLALSLLWAPFFFFVPWRTWARRPLRSWAHRSWGIWAMGQGATLRCSGLFRERHLSLLCSLPSWSVGFLARPSSPRAWQELEVLRLRLFLPCPRAGIGPRPPCFIPRRHPWERDAVCIAFSALAKPPASRALCQAKRAPRAAFPSGWRV